MIERLKIKNLGVIRSAEIEFARGFTVVTGETGAGKTMVLTALGLICGGKPDPGLVSKGSETTAIEGFFVLPEVSESELTEKIDDCGASAEDGLLIIARDVPKDGRARCVVGGKSVPASVAADITENLVTVHGQGDQARLAKPSQQRQLLDRFAGPIQLDLLRELGETFIKWQQTKSVLSGLRANTAQAALELQALQADLAEVAAFDPKVDEFKQLEQDLANLVNSGEILDGLAVVIAALEGVEGESTGSLNSLSIAVNALHALGRYGKQYEEAQAELQGSMTSIGQLVADLKQVYSDFDLDPASLAAAQERKAGFVRFGRRFDIDPNDLTSWQDLARQRVLDLDPDPTRLATLEADVERLEGEALATALKISQNRIKAGVQLSRMVTNETNELAMPKACFEVKVTTKTDLVAELASHGYDEVEFLFSAHDASELRPLAKAASGGERSRVMLALEVVLASADPVPTFVFDEVDAGVGGKAAVEVGRRLARLGQHAQVIVVTHLPQVAAFAEGHIRVEKGLADEVSTTDVRRLDEKERVAELSRMLAGVEESAAARQHAEELIAMGEAERAQLVHF